MNKPIKLLLLLLVVVATSCNVAEKMQLAAVDKYGYLPNVEATKENIAAYASEWGIEQEELYFLDKQGYRETIWSIDKENEQLTHDLYQWHQLFVFDNSEGLLSYQVNCRTKVKDNNWNYDSKGTFDTYPPNDDSLKDFNKDLQLSQIAPYFINSEGNSLMDEDIADYDIVIVAYWTIYHGRQSENLINTVLDFKNQYSDKRIKYVFVNNDGSPTYES